MRVIDHITVEGGTYGTGNPVFEYIELDFAKCKSMNPCMPFNTSSSDGAQKGVEYTVSIASPTYTPPPNSPVILPDDWMDEYKEPLVDLDRFSKIKRKGEIKFSPYSRHQVRRHYYVITDSRVDTMPVVISSRDWNKPNKNVNGYWSSNGTSRAWPAVFKHSLGLISACGYEVVCDQLSVDPRSSAIDASKRTVTYSHTSSSLTPVGGLLFEMPCLDEVINRVKTETISRLRMGYDLGTELAELRESLVTIQGLLTRGSSLIRNFKTRLERNPSKHARKRARRAVDASVDAFNSEWLNFRYGIMPIIYSIQDIQKLIADKDKKFKKVRSVEAVSISFDPTALVDKVPYGTFYDQASGVITISGTGKAKFDNSLSRLSHQIHVNPVTAFWETIPLSMIVDWFVDVGDWLFITSSEMFNSLTGVEEKYCYAIKTTVVVDRFRSCKDEVYHNNILQSTSLSRKRYETVIYNNYDRFPFTVKDIVFPGIDIQLSSWKRQVDAFAIFLKPFRKSLRSL